MQTYFECFFWSFFGSHYSSDISESTELSFCESTCDVGSVSVRRCGECWEWYDTSSEGGGASETISWFSASFLFFFFFVISGKVPTESGGGMVEEGGISVRGGDRENVVWYEVSIGTSVFSIGGGRRVEMISSEDTGKHLTFSMPVAVMCLDGQSEGD